MKQRTKRYSDTLWWQWHNLGGANDEFDFWLCEKFYLEEGDLVSARSARLAFEGRQEVKGIAPEPVPQLRPSERFAILKRDSYRCRLCGASAREDNVTLHVDHITARSKGGDNDPLNLWTLCAACNRGKGTQDL